MTMDFVLANPGLVDKLKAGAPVTSNSSNEVRASG
jgi:hypothetical protein